MAGAPRLDVDYEQLLQLLQSRVKKSEIAQLFGVSRPTLDRIITDYQLEDLGRWWVLGDSLTICFDNPCRSQTLIVSRAPLPASQPSFVSYTFLYNLVIIQAKPEKV